MNEFVYILFNKEEEVIAVFNDFFSAIQKISEMVNKNKKRLEEFGIFKYLKLEKEGASFNFKEFYFEIERKRIE